MKNFDYTKQLLPWFSGKSIFHGHFISPDSPGRLTILAEITQNPPNSPSLCGIPTSSLKKPAFSVFWDPELGQTNGPGSITETRFPSGISEPSAAACHTFRGGIALFDRKENPLPVTNFREKPTWAAGGRLPTVCEAHCTVLSFPTINITEISIYK